MVYAILVIAILILGCVWYVIKTKSTADKLPAAKAETKQAAEKATALEKTANEERQAEHDEDVEEAEQVLESRDRDRAIGFLIGSVRRKAGTPSKP